MHFFIITAILASHTFHITEGYNDNDCSPYQSIGPNHTMCIYSVDSGCAKIDRGVTPEDIEDILDAHNTVRQKIANAKQVGQPSASNMNQLKWNEELETIAQRWADQCAFSYDKNRHTKDFKVGQNVALIASTRKGNDKNFTSVTYMWYNEVRKIGGQSYENFKYNPKTEHYTQVIWADTTDIGCGYAYYMASGKKFPYRKLYICNYGPAGNVDGKSAYEFGGPCTKCAKACSSTYPGLCSNENGY